MVWLGMGFEIVFELYVKKKGLGYGLKFVYLLVFYFCCMKSESEFYVCVLFGGKVLKLFSLIFGKMDMVLVEIFLGYFDVFVGKEVSKVKVNCN